MQVQRDLSDRVGKDFWMYSITLRPEQDSPKAMAEYAEAMGVGPGWLFLTGHPEDIHTLRLNLGFYDPEEPDFGKELSQHVGFLLMGNEPNGWWGTVPSTAGPKQIVQLIDWLKPGSRGLR